jgi:sirohydrochlorin cobaltochelatase
LARVSVTEPRRLLESLLAGDRVCIGQISIERSDRAFVLCHRDDLGRRDLHDYPAENAREIARFDDAGNYRPLKTAPDLRHGWRLEIVDLTELRRALDYFYPGRLAMFAEWKENRLTTTTLRETLDRQSGMYRVAAKISDEQINDLVGRFCRSNDGCLRTILWKRDDAGASVSSQLPARKFDPAFDQTGHGESVIPLLCQEACHLLVAEARKIVRIGSK